MNQVSSIDSFWTNESLWHRFVRLRSDSRNWSSRLWPISKSLHPCQFLSNGPRVQVIHPEGCVTANSAMGENRLLTFQSGARKCMWKRYGTSTNDICLLSNNTMFRIACILLKKDASSLKLSASIDQQKLESGLSCWKYSSVPFAFYYWHHRKTLRCESDPTIRDLLCTLQRGSLHIANEFKSSAGRWDENRRRQSSLTSFKEASTRSRTLYVWAPPLLHVRGVIDSSLSLFILLESIQASFGSQW